MDAPFPFGFPLHTAIYLSLLVGTWVLHVVFMHYVLGGTAYLAVRTVWMGNRAETGTAATLLREWLPFVLSAAITAGIAPLLFAQVTYQHRFYTANLLLFYRWLAILPALLLGFYLMYLLKSQAAILNRAALRVLAKLIVCACFLYVAWLWTTNHLLSVQSLDTWTRQYASGTVMYRTAEILPRLALWLISSFPTLAVWLAWQLWFNLNRGTELLADVDRDTTASDIRHTALLGLVGLALMGVSAAFYAAQLPATDRSTLTGPLARSYLAAACIGMAGQCAAWIMMWRRQRLTVPTLILLSAGLWCTLLGLGVLRESLRIARVNIVDLYPAHELAATVSGRWLFVAVLIVNTALMAWCLRIVQHAQK